MRVPQETMRVAAQVEKVAEQMVREGNKNAVSDAKSAVYLAQAAQKSAMENVEINKQALAKLNKQV
ncbi:MAG: cyclodeaminase/cyclohydrolase family protein, partial [Patescibacteria group bacterium]